MSARKALDPEFREKTIKLRGTSYRFRELTGRQYEDFVKESEGPDGSADLSTVLKMMIPESLQDPKLTADEILSKPLPVYNALAGVVNELHFRSEPEEVEPEAEESGEAQPGNDSEPQTT